MGNQLQFHIIGVDTTNNDLVNQLINNILMTFSGSMAWYYNIIDGTTFDIFVTLEG